MDYETKLPPGTVKIKDLELTVHIRNNRLKERRLERGLSQAMLAKYCGIALGYVSAAECLREIPPGAMWKLSDYFEVDIGELFPEAIRDVKRNTVLLGKADVLELKAIEHRIIDPRSLEVAVRKRLAAEKVHEIIDSLSERESEILKRRYFEGETYSAIGRAMKVTTERVRRVEHKAIKRMRQGKRMFALREALQNA